MRSWLAGLCLTLAAVLSVPAIIGYWAVNTLGNTANFVAVTAPLAADQRVQEVVSAQVSQQVVSSLGLGDVLGDALTQAVDSVVMGVLDTAAFARVWTSAMAGAQRALIAGLSGDGVSAQGESVTVDLSPLLAEVRAGLVAKGLTRAETAELPQLEIQLDVLDATTLRRAQASYRLLRPVAAFLPWAAVALLVAAVVLARRRARMLFGVGLVVAGSALLVSLVVAIGGAAFNDALSGRPLAPLSGPVYDQLVSSLTSWWPKQLIGGAVLAVAGLGAWFWTGRANT